MRELGIATVVRNAHVVAGAPHPRFFSYVCEMSLAIIFEEPIGIFRRVFLQRLYVSAIGEENVEFAIVVVVKHSNTAGHGFRRMALRSLIALEFEIYGLKGKADRAAG